MHALARSSLLCLFIFRCVSGDDMVPILDTRTVKSVEQGQNHYKGSGYNVML